MQVNPFVLFLDIDGVLNTKQDFSRDASIRKYNIHIINSDLLKNLHTYVQEFNPMVVVSSMWRHDMSRKDIEKVLNIEIADTTQIGEELPSRSDEITEWMLRTNTKKAVIFDDDLSVVEVVPGQSRLVVLTDSNHGLNAERLEYARQKTKKWLT